VVDPSQEMMIVVVVGMQILLEVVPCQQILILVVVV